MEGLGDRNFVIPGMCKIVLYMTSHLISGLARSRSLSSKIWRHWNADFCIDCYWWNPNANLILRSLLVRWLVFLFRWLVGCFQRLKRFLLVFGHLKFHSFFIHFSWRCCIYSFWSLNIFYSSRIFFSLKKLSPLSIASVLLLWKFSYMFGPLDRYSILKNFFKFLFF